MPFDPPTPKAWHNDPNYGIAPMGTDTPMDAAGLTDLEQRMIDGMVSLAAYVDSRAAVASTITRTILNKSDSQSVTSGAAAVKALWNVEREDSLNAWDSGNPGDIIIPDTGFYAVTVCPAWDTQSSTGVRAYHLQVAPGGDTANAVMLSAHHDSPAVYNGCYPFAWQGTLNAGDVLSVWVYHEAGTTIGFGASNRPLVSLGQSRNCEICVARIGPAEGNPPNPPIPPPSSTSTTLFLPEGQGSPWNSPLPVDAPIDPDNATLLSSLNDIFIATSRGAWIESGNYSTNVYTPAAGITRTPMTLMSLADITVAETQDEFGTSRERLAWRLAQGIPLTDDMRAVNGTDAHMTVIDDSTGELWDLITVWRDGGVIPWQDSTWSDPNYRAAHWGTGTWRCWYGGYMADHTVSPGFFEDITDPYESSLWGATATSLPIVAGLIREQEMLDGVIPHALQMVIPNPLSGHNWPAQRDDGYPVDSAFWVDQGLTPTVKEGTILRLKSTVPDAVTTGYGATFDAAMQILRVALKTYGCIIDDRTSNAILFRAEPSQAMYMRFNPGGWDPWPAPYSNAVLATGLPAFTTSNWEVIDTSIYRPDVVATPFADTTDDFADNSIDAAKWPTATDCSETGGQMHLQLVGSTYAALETPTGQKLTSSHISAHVVQVPSGDAADQGGLTIISEIDANCSIRFWVDNGNLKAQYQNDSLSTVVVTSSAYSSTTHKWWRVSESGGTVTFETSTDGASWTTYGSFTWSTSGWPATNLDNMHAEWFAGNFNGVAGQPDMIIDDYNL